MFCINRDIELTPSLLQKMINRFQTGVYPHLKRYWDYYNGNQRIYEKAYNDPSKPCNKTVINYCKNIADSYCGYIASPRCIGYSSDNDIDEIMDILRYLLLTFPRYRQVEIRRACYELGNHCWLYYTDGLCYHDL